MALSDVPGDLYWVRARIGDTPDDGILDDIYLRDGYGSRGAVALWVLENRLANMLADPVQFAISGQYSQSTSGNIDGIQKMISAVRSEIAAGYGDDGAAFDGSPSVGLLSREDYEARR